MNLLERANELDAEIRQFIETEKVKLQRHRRGAEYYGKLVQLRSELLRTPISEAVTVVNETADHLLKEIYHIDPDPDLPFIERVTP